MYISVSYHHCKCRSVITFRFGGFLISIEVVQGGSVLTVSSIT